MHGPERPVASLGRALFRSPSRHLARLLRLRRVRLGHGASRRWKPRWAMPAAFEAARIEAGVPEMGHELTDKTIPQEAGALVEHAVSFTKGCYTGQELVARLDARGGNVARRLRGVVLRPGRTSRRRGRRARGLGSRESAGLTSIAWSPGFSSRSPSPMCDATSRRRPRSPWPRGRTGRDSGTSARKSDRQRPWLPSRSRSARRCATP